MSIREIEVKQDLILNANKNPKGYFKCIFIAGPPASGKTTIVTQLFSHDINLSSYNLMIANPDQYFESLLSKYNVSYDRRAGKQSKEQWDKQQQLWELSKELFYKKLKSTISDKTGLIIDVTGAGFDSLIKRKFMVQNTGYDVMMIYVSCGLQLALRRNSERTRKIPQQYLISAHDILQKYKIRYQRIFGDNFIDISTNTSQPTAVNDYIKTKVASFLNKPISNSIAQRWILKQRELSNDLNPKPFNIQQDATQNEMRKICMFAGRFQPFTPSHFKAYTIAVQRFGKQNVFISTSNVTNNKNSPFNFQQKQLIISTMFNIPKENIILNKSPYSVQVFSNMVDTQNTILYVINTQKDDRLTRSGGYFKSKQPKTLKPFSQQAYIFNVGYPHENYKGVELSGTYLRSLFTNEDTSVQQKKKIFKQIYGKFDQTIFKLIMSKLNPNVLITQGGAYGQELQYFNEKGFTQCQFCKKYFKQINNKHLLNIHGITVQQYKKQYPVISNIFKNIGSKNPMSDPKVRKVHKEAVNKKQYKQKQRVLSTGRYPNESTKKKMSENNAMHNQKYRQAVSIGVKKSYTNELKQLRSRSMKNARANNPDWGRTKMEQSGKWKSKSLISQFQKYKTMCIDETKKSYNIYFNEIPNAKLRSRKYHLDHKYSILQGYINDINPKIIGHYKNLEILHHSLNESKGAKCSITIDELQLTIQQSMNPINESGAYGHLDHPYDDPELSFSTIKEMISDVLSGQINVKSEQQITIKTDGQNLLISWRDGKLIAARNKGHLKANGANALDSNALKSLFAGRGEIQKAFSLSMDDLSQAFGSLSQRQLKEIFNEGSRWISIQIIYDGTTNVIVYGKNMLVFHGIISVDPDGNKTSFDKNMTRQIYRIFTNINSNIQNTFEIKPTTIVNIPKSKDFSERRSYFLNKVDKLQNKYNLSQQNTIQDYIKSAWTPVILQYAEQANYDIPKDILSGLLLRWAQNDSSYSLLQFKKDCNNPQFLRVAIDIDKNSKQSITKDILYPWQIIFLELGVQVMKNLNQYMVAHPSKTISKIRSEVEATIDTIKSSNNIKYLNQLERPLKKLEAIGGLDSIVPQQGVVFNYKGKNYKLTGSFAPVNAILGIIRYAS